MRVIDSDVIINFQHSKFEHLIYDIFDEPIVILTHVALECSINRYKDWFDHFVDSSKGKLKVIEYEPDVNSEEYEEYELLSKTKGKGESACLSYALFHPGTTVISSNMSDIQNYCKKNEIATLGTVDLFEILLANNKMTIKEAAIFVDNLKNIKDRLPYADLENIIKKYDKTPLLKTTI